MGDLGFGTGLVGGALAAVFVIGAIVTSVFIWIGALLAGVEGAGFVRALAVAVLNAIIGGVATVVLGVGAIPPPVGMLIGLVITLFLIKAIFGTTWGKALLTWVFAIIAEIIVVVLMVVGGVALVAGFAG
jgi:hypothetical protein